MDSLKRFFATKSGRKVLEYGGITPDSTVNAEDPGMMVKEMLRKAMFFKFANKWFAEHKGETFAAVNEAMLKEFKKYLDDQKFDYKEESDGKVKELRSIAERSHYTKEVLADLDLLSSALEKEKERGFERYKNHIERELQIEMAARVKGETGRIAASLKGDKQLDVAMNILKSTKVYAKKIKG